MIKEIYEIDCELIGGPIRVTCLECFAGGLAEHEGIGVHFKELDDGLIIGYFADGMVIAVGYVLTLPDGIDLIIEGLQVKGMNNWQEICEEMDAEIMEELHHESKLMDEVEFVSAYMWRHLEKHDVVFELEKEVI